PAVRLLHAGRGDDHGLAHRKRRPADGGAAARGGLRPPVPLHRLPGDPARRAQARRLGGEGARMNAPSNTGLAAARFIGQRVPRKEDARLLTGKGAYVDDVSLPGMLEIAFVRSQVARGAIRAIDLEAARAVPGVRAIYTAQDLAVLNPKLFG